MVGEQVFTCCASCSILIARNARAKPLQMMVKMIACSGTFLVRLCSFLYCRLACLATLVYTLASYIQCGNLQDDEYYQDAGSRWKVGRTVVGEQVSICCARCSILIARNARVKPLQMMVKKIDCSGKFLVWLYSFLYCTLAWIATLYASQLYSVRQFARWRVLSGRRIYTIS